MTISAISSFSASAAASFQTDRQAFGQLTNALQSGNLTAAQDAYNTLASSPLAQGNSPFAQALKQIGQDLQSGDIAGAQKALASLQQQQQARGGHHHHHHHGGGGVSGAPETSKTSGNSASDPDAYSNSSTVLQIDITVTTDSENKVDIKA